MITRKDFIKKGLLAGAATALPLAKTSKASAQKAEPGLKHWVWIRPDHKDTRADLQERYSKYYEAGIRAVFFEEDSEKHFRAAKEQGLEAHRWMWTMNRPDKELLTAHPEWYAVNREGVSCADHPPYVDYYRWLCPSRQEVQDYLAEDVQSILSKDYIDGIHLDYVRYCDVILPVNLWSKYDIVQTKELPEYDFCYCGECQRQFKAWRGDDISAIEYPSASLSWRLFRYDAITKIVNRLSEVAQNHNKAITAAVFPTPEVARRNVRQDWTNWNLDGICPMIYHGFYKEPVAWIGDAVAAGIHGLNDQFPLYAGLFLPDFKNDKELKAGIEYALQQGAKGISLFGQITDDNLSVLKQASHAFKKG